MTSPPLASTISRPTTCLAVIVAALDQHTRAHALDQIERRILLEHRDQIDRLQAGQHFGARLLVLQRTLRALVRRAHRCVAVEADHQAIAGRARLRQHAGHGRDAANRNTPLVKPMRRSCARHSFSCASRSFTVRTIFSSVASAAGGRMRCAQFVGGHDRGAALADRDRSRGIGRAHRRLEIGAERQQHRKHRHHRIARAGNVAHFHRIGRRVNGLASLHLQQHAVFAQGHQHRRSSRSASPVCWPRPRPAHAS